VISEVDSPGQLRAPGLCALAEAGEVLFDAGYVAIVIAGWKNAGGEVAVGAFGAAERNRNIKPKHFHISLFSHRHRVSRSECGKGHLDNAFRVCISERNNSGGFAFISCRDDPVKEGRMRGSGIREQFEAEPEEVSK
jgi:hypothetical protein